MHSHLPKGPFSRATLHVRVLLSVVAISLLLIGLDGWWTWQSRTAAIASDQAVTANLARSLAQHAHNTIQVADTILLGMRERFEAEGLDPKRASNINESIRTRVANVPSVHSLFVYDAAGMRFASSVPASLGIPSNADRGYFQYHRDHPDRGAYIGRPVQGRADGSWVITVSRRMNLADGRFGGVVLATISVASLERFYKSFAGGKNSVISLDFANGIAVVRSTGSEKLIGSDISKLDVFSKYLTLAPVGSFGFVSPLDQVSRLVSYRLLDDYPLVSVVAHARDEVLADWRTDAMLHLGITVGAILTMLFLGTRFGRQIKRWEIAERHYRILADNVGDIVILKNATSYAYVSPASKRILGYEPSEMAKLKIDDLIHPDDLQSALAAQKRLSPTNPVTVDIHRNFRKDGRCIWAEVLYRRIDHSDASGPTMALTVRDVSARVDAERQAMQAADRATLALEATNDFVFAVDKDWRFTYVSKRTRAIWTEFDPSSGRTLWDVVPWIVGTASETCYRRAMAERISLEVTDQVLSGRWYTAHAAPLSDEDCGMFVFFRDVTDSKRVEASLIEARTAAEAIARAKSDFLANMSHELRTPLNAVIGFAELIERSESLPTLVKRHREYATDIRESGEHLLSLINDVLDYSKMEAGRLLLHQTAVSPKDLVESCVRMMRPRADRMNISLHASLEETPTAIVADEMRIRQIILNLLSNSIKFTPVGGRIEIDCRSADGLVIAVRDNGIGIPADEIDRVMEAFTQVDDLRTRSQEGTGLGLPLSRRLAEMHGGTLHIESTLGTGTTVTLRIPQTTAPALPLEIQPPESTAAGVVLVAEDDAAIRAEAAAGLRSHGFEVIEASSVPEALAILQQSLHIDILIVDTTLPPGLAGLTLARKARQMHPDIGVFLTSSSDEHLAAPAGALDGFSVLPKPYRPDELARLIRQVLRAAKQAAGRVAA